MYKLGEIKLRKLFDEAYNKGYRDAMTNIARKGGEPVGYVKEQDEWFKQWVKDNL